MWSITEEHYKHSSIVLFSKTMENIWMIFNMNVILEKTLNRLNFY